MEVIAVQLIKSLEVSLLAVEQLHNVHPADILCYIGIDTRMAHADSAEVITHSTTEIGSNQEEWRHDKERHQRKLSVDDKQQDSYVEDSESISKNAAGA